MYYYNLKVKMTLIYCLFIINTNVNAVDHEQKRDWSEAIILTKPYAIIKASYKEINEPPIIISSLVGKKTSILETLIPVEIKFTGENIEISKQFRVIDPLITEKLMNGKEISFKAYIKGGDEPDDIISIVPMNTDNKSLYFVISVMQIGSLKCIIIETQYNKKNE
jgi:hypothetical protein